MNSIGNATRSPSGVVQLAWHAADQVPALVTDKAQAADGVVLLTLEVPDRPVPPWAPGAHIELELRPGAATLGGPTLKGQREGRS